MKKILIALAATLVLWCSPSVSLAATPATHTLTLSISLDPQEVPASVNDSPAWIAQYEYDSSGNQISLKTVGAAPRITPGNYLNPATSSTVTWVERLNPGMHHFVYYLVDRLGNKISNACFGSLPLDILVDTNRTAAISIINLCLLGDKTKAGLHGNINFNNEIISLDPAHHTYTLLLALRTKDGTVVRSQNISGFTLAPPFVDPQQGPLMAQYVMNSVPPGIYTLCACIVDENGNRVYCGCFGGNSAVKFELDSGDSAGLDLIVGLCNNCFNP